MNELTIVTAFFDVGRVNGKILNIAEQMIHICSSLSFGQECGII